MTQHNAKSPLEVAMTCAELGQIPSELDHFKRLGGVIVAEFNVIVVQASTALQQLITEDVGSCSRTRPQHQNCSKIARTELQSAVRCLTGPLRPYGCSGNAPASCGPSMELISAKGTRS
mmetsp:Transcript_13260/g.23346  ORF Transcript_13260/g.23346 Transcript_13260/m.23346 type:complete len:119 (+) Transcript_13260:867-1223(+)